MAQLQPNGVVMDGFHQNGLYFIGIGPQHIRINLVPNQSAPLRRQAKFRQAGPDALRKGLPGVGNAGDVLLLAENLHPVFPAVGHHAKLNIRLRLFSRKPSPVPRWIDRNGTNCMKKPRKVTQ